MQTDEYIRNYFTKDPPYIKSFVLPSCSPALPRLTHVAFTVCICQGTYTMNVTDFGETIRLLFTPLSINAAIILGGIIDHSVQAPLAARAHRVTGALHVSIGLRTMVAFLQGVSLKLAQESIYLDSIVLVGQKSSWLLSALFFGDASLDIVMASVLIYYLTQQKRTAFKSTAALLNRLVRYTIQTGLATSFVAMGAALSFKFAPNYYIWTAFVILMPGSFTIALLANINGRRSLIQPVGPVSTGADPLSLESGVVITYSRNVVVCSSFEFGTGNNGHRFLETPGNR
ncbi:hypothetical protein DFH08DRAFT_890663 [Mycena albidolilacea]|uniref:DUF6534 domain-containing protein n=1 Tax=Mycena albidolilacea TaxID=1033008 RepID=A0AAD7EGH4_9AGAR|nr:hypothetical protein DFH08DRAFT_890663 [Mycena albidolilacea]